MSRLLDVAAALERMAKALAGTEQGEACAFAVRIMREREEIVKQKWLDTERLDAIERMIRAGHYNQATGRTELTALNCHLVCTCGIRAVVDLAIEEGRVPSNGGAS